MMFHYTMWQNTDHYNAVPKPEVSVGDRIRGFEDDNRSRNWWEVRADSEHFTALARQAPFKEKGVMEYTVCDWRNGVRGPCNLIGQGYGDGSYSREECERMLAEFESGELEVSQRNWVRLAGELIRFPVEAQ